MFPQNEALLVIQHRNERVLQIEKELANFPLYDAALQKALADRTAECEKIRAEARAAEVERKKLDLEAESVRAQIARYKQQQLQTRKNDEYAALAHEIIRAEQTVKETEDREIELMERSEVAQKKVSVMSAELKAFEQKNTKERAEAKARNAQLQGELVEAIAARTEAEANVPEEVLLRYRRILGNKKRTKAIVPVHNGSCTGCNMKVTTNSWVRIKAEDALVSCDICGRLLYWDGE